jgi:hypothetical protein
MVMSLVIPVVGLAVLLAVVWLVLERSRSDRAA